MSFEADSIFTDGPSFPCPCCGYLVFSLPPGYHGVCPICHWEDDLSQLRFPLMPGSTNHVSLQAAQKNFADFGAGELRHVDKVREPDEVDRQDKNWRPLDENTDNIEQPGSGIDYANFYPVDSTVLYYWRKTYWRRMVS